MGHCVNVCVYVCVYLCVAVSPDSRHCRWDVNLVCVCVCVCVQLFHYVREAMLSALSDSGVCCALRWQLAL